VKGSWDEIVRAMSSFSLHRRSEAQTEGKNPPDIPSQSKKNKIERPGEEARGTLTLARPDGLKNQVLADC
jgi:hypothetical protein